MENYVKLKTIDTHTKTFDTHSCIYEDHLYHCVARKILIYNLIIDELIYTETKFENDPEFKVIEAIFVLDDTIYLSLFRWNLGHNQVIAYRSKHGKYITLDHPRNIMCYSIPTDEKTLYFGYTNGYAHGRIGKFDGSEFTEMFVVPNTRIRDVHYYKNMIIVIAYNIIKIFNIHGDIISLFETEFHYASIILRNGLLYGFQLGMSEFIIINLNQHTSKNISMEYRCRSVFVSNNKLYIIGYNDTYQMIFRIDEEDIFKIRNIETTRNKSILTCQDKVYFINNTGIDVYGEYFHRHYFSLPTSQKSKIKKWKSISPIANIHKDISLLFTRELLK